MTGGSNIRAVGPDEQPQSQVAATDAHDDDTLALTEEYLEYEEEESPSSSRFGWVLPGLAIAGIVAWTGFYFWAHQSEILAGGTPQQWSAWIVAWAIPTLLLATLWLLGMRTSRREARRFGEIANMLNAESAQLEARLAVVNRELSLAREFLASQSRELDSLGRIATDRLSTHADALQGLIHSNGSQIDAIATVSTTALENMGKLRDDLPVIANSAKDVSNQIGNAGRTAHEQVDQLISGFERLNEFGNASERQVGSLQSRVDAALSAFETQLAQMDELTGSRFNALREKSEEFRTELDGREVEALAAMRRRADTLAEELDGSRASLEEQEEEALRSMRSRLTTMRDEAKALSNSIREAEDLGSLAWSKQIDELRSRLVAAIDEIKAIDESALESANSKLEALRQEAETVDRNIAERDARLYSKIAERQAAMAETQNAAHQEMQAKLEEFDAVLAERRSAFHEQTAKIGEQGEAVAARLWELRADMEAIAEQGQATEQRLGNQLAALTGQLAESKEALAGSDQAVAELTEASVRLLELLQASAQQSRVDLPEAISVAEARLTEIRGHTEAMRAMFKEVHAKGDDLSSYVLSARDSGREASQLVTDLHEQVAAANAASQESIENLRASLASLAHESENLSEQSQGRLRSAIVDLETAARHVVETIGGETDEAIRSLAQRVATASGEAIERSLHERTGAALAELDEATAKSATAGRDAAIQLRDQLAKVNELASNLEARVAHAREKAEEQVDNDFARRVALITESLNSNAIDIDKALATDVADTEWASYLRGDRGIFTRRAVRLLDNTEAREIAEFYDEDSNFRDNVSRYIADFESMLRTLLSTRDGKALGVTILGSDMGKLYVALAQAIERLRD